MNRMRNNGVKHMIALDHYVKRKDKTQRSMAKLVEKPEEVNNMLSKLNEVVKNRLFLLMGALTHTSQLKARIEEYKTINLVMMKYRWIKHEVINSEVYNVWKQQYVEITN